MFEVTNVLGDIFRMKEIFYLQSRGIPEIDAMKMVVNGFLEPMVKKLPLEYSVEFRRLVELELEGSVG